MRGLLVSLLEKFPRGQAWYSSLRRDASPDARSHLGSRRNFSDLLLNTGVCVRRPCDDGRVSGLHSVLTHEIGFGLALLLTGVAIGLVLYLRARWQAFRRHRIALRRSKRSMRGERLAELLLEKRGYTIVERQLQARSVVSCDGAEESFVLRADLLVERHGEQMIAEVKTGERAPEISNVATRRQLLEYALVYRSPCILLVDIERERVREVRFDLEFADDESAIAS